MFVYILPRQPPGTLYIGVTADLVQRVWGNREKAVAGFTPKYNVTRLVYFEQCDDPVGAITREKQLRKWRRAWKVQLIESADPDWIDLYAGLTS